jgi:phosphoribosylaminoimidazole carboxylase PurE protein
MKVAVLIGSDSDYPVVEGALNLLKEFGIPSLIEVTSAHRSPKRTLGIVQKFEEEGAGVFICAAGKAAHLAGVVAAHTVLPVIGVPVGGSSLSGMDALFSTVQMPKGVPVACMGLGKSGAINAALLAVQILSFQDESLLDKLRAYKKQMAVKVEESSKKIKDLS